MTQEEKKLLLIDLYVRIPYGVKVQYYENETFLVDGEVEYVHNDYVKIKNKDKEVYIMGVKPYLRSMSSMTDEERKEYKSFIFTQYHEWDGHGTSTDYVETNDVESYFIWLNKKGVDYRGLIPKGLALEAPEDMYKN